MRALAAAVLILGASAAHAATDAPPLRSALVIGNQQYKQWRPLQTANNDAEAMAKALTALGYQTELIPDASRDTMLRAAATLATRLTAPHHSVVFYYAGHAVQIEGLNYLVPVDVPPEPGARPIDGLVSLSELLRPLLRTDAGVAKIILLDACRNNPLALRLGSRPGLAQPSIAPENALIGYATVPDHVAEDGDWAHAPYTKALLQELGRVGQNLDDTMTRVRNFVVAMTDHDQTPWIAKSMPREFFFREPILATVAFRDVDDAGIVTLNGTEIASSVGRPEAAVRLAPGRNELTVMIYNQKTYTGNNPIWGMPEGWRFWLSLALSPGVRVSSTPPPSESCGLMPNTPTLRLIGAENRPPRHGNRHGGMFTATKAVIDVDEFTGDVTVASADCEAWRR